MALRSAERHLNGPAPTDPAPAAVSDETLALQAAALADVRAFETLMRRHERRVFYLLRRFTGEAAVAEELCQETFLRAWRKLGSFEGRGAFGGWLTRLAHNVYLQHRRRLSNRVSNTSFDDAEADAAEGNESAASRQIDAEAADLPRMLAVVSADERRLLVLAYAEGMSLPEIGELLGIAPGNVKSQIHRAKQKIRHHFQIGTTA